MERIVQKRIPDKLARNAELDPLITKLKQEVGGDYDFSVRKSIGEFKGDQSYTVKFVPKQSQCTTQSTVFSQYNTITDKMPFSFDEQ